MTLKHCMKRGKCWKSAFSPFRMFFHKPPPPPFYFSVTFILSAANAFSLDQSKYLSFGIELTNKSNVPCSQEMGLDPITHYQTTIF